MGRSSPLGIEGTAVSFRDRDEKGRLTVAQVRARDESGAWQCKRFAVMSWRRDGTPILSDLAREWARETRKSFVKGEAVARAATFQDFAELLCENLAASGVGQGRIKLIKTVAAGLLRAGVTDMRTDVFPARVRSWITGLRAGWSFAEDAKNRRLTSPPLSPATRNKLLVICRQVTGLAVKKRRLPFDPLSELPRFIEPLYIKPVFTIDELRRMVSDEARDHAMIAQATLAAVDMENTERSLWEHYTSTVRHTTGQATRKRRDAVSEVWKTLTGASLSGASGVWEWMPRKPSGDCDLPQMVRMIRGCLLRVEGELFDGPAVLEAGDHESVAPWRAQAACSAAERHRAAMDYVLAHMEL